MDKKNTPEVKLGQYKGLAVTRHVRPVTDKTVDIELVHQTRMHAVYHPTTEPARRGFRALLDFAGYMDGKEIVNAAEASFAPPSKRNLNLVFQFKDIPLLTKVISVPKQNYATTDRKAILDMITKDMEFAVEWVPEQKDMDMVGQVNKGACRQLLIKCYLATGQWEKAKEQADILIDKSGYELMKEPFGIFRREWGA